MNGMCNRLATDAMHTNSTPKQNRVGFFFFFLIFFFEERVLGSSFGVGKKREVREKG
jgi:hypothetical protein